MQDQSEASDSDDEVVRELDVYLCKGTLPEGSKMYLLQSPLRPPWRPYELDKAENVQMKPGAGRLQLDVPLPPMGPNVNADEVPMKQRKHLRLISSPAELPTSFAVGAVRDGKLLLVPVDGALQLRPSMAHLNEEAKAAGRHAAAEEEEEEKPFERQTVKVSVQRRETERQTEMRLKSYSHHAKREGEEPWVPLQLHGADSAAAHSVWGRLTSPAETPVPMNMSRAEYLDSFVPGSGIDDTGVGGSGWPDGGEGADAMDLGAPDSAPNLAGYPPALAPIDPHRPVAPETLPGLRQALTSLFAHHNVVDLPNIRRFLQQSPEAGAVEAGQAGDAHLRNAIAALPDMALVRGRFVQTHVGDGRDDALRAVVLDLLEDKDSLKRGDIHSAAKAKGVTWSDSIYQRIMKVTCDNVGNAWALKSGDIS